MGKTIQFKNCINIAVAVHLDFPDNERVVGVIWPNDTLTIEADKASRYPVYCFCSRIGRRPPELSPRYTYDPAFPDGVVHEIKFSKEESITYGQMRVENTSNLDLYLERFDSVNFYRVGLIKSYSEEAFYCSVNQPHILRDAYSGQIVDYFPPPKPNIYGQVTYSYRDNPSVAPLKNIKPVTLRFINCLNKKTVISNRGIGLAWIDVGGIKEINSHTGEVLSYGVTSYHYEWSDNYDYFPSTEDKQNVFIYYKKEGFEVSFYNQMNLLLKAYLVVNGERHFFGEIAPHDIFTRYSYKGAEWQFTAKFGDEETGMIHQTVIGEAGTYNINGNHLGQAILAESKTRTVRLSNQSPFEVNIQEKTTDERLGDVLGAIPPGGAKDFTIQVGKTLEARDKYSNHRIAQLVVPHGDGIFNYDIQLKSWNSQHAAKLSIYNRTSILLDVFWLDYDGKEQKITEIAPGGATRLETYLTHPWIIKDRRSGRIIERIYVKQRDEVVDIRGFGVTPKEGQPEVKINFRNKLPFAVDLYKVTAAHQEEFLKTMPPEESYQMTNQNATPVRIREFQSQAEIELYVPGTAPVQNLDIQLKAPESARKTAVEIINLSVFKVEVFKFDTNGSPQKVTELKSRMSKKLSDVIVGQPFYLQEADSGTVVGYFVSTVPPLRFEFSGITLRSVYSPQANRVTFENLSGFDIDVYWMNFKGEEELKGHMAPKSKSNNRLVIGDARIGHIYVFREQTSNTFLDEKILYSSRDSQTIQINPQIISQTERAPDQLWPGEVALFTQPNYKGTAYIFHKDVYGAIQEINDKVQSIKLGPGTALTAFKDYKFGGENDVFYMDTPDLSETDIKYSMSSFQISTITPELASGISAISRLTEEPVITPNGGKNTISYRSVFRTTLSFPTVVSAVDIFATEETKFTVGNKEYTVDPVRHARIHISSTKQIVLTTPATKLRESILMLRTDTMHTSERFFVFQDVDAHKKLAKLEAGAFARNKAKLGINGNYTDQQLEGVQTAVQNLANTIPAVHATKAHGQTKDLYVAPKGMQYDTWGVNFKNGESAGNDQQVFQPLSPDEAKAATRENDTTVKRRNLDTEVGQFGFGSLKKLAKGATNLVIQPVKAVKKKVEEAAEVTADVARKGVSAVADTAKDTAQVVATTGVSAVNLVKSGAKDVGEFASDTTSAALKLPSKAIALVEDVVDEGLSVGETVFKATIDLGGEIIEFTVDTVDKVADCIELIVTKVVESVEKVIDFLKDLFNWQDILDTQEILVQYFNSSIDGIRKNVIPKMEGEIRKLLDKFEGRAMEAIDEMMDDYGAGMNTPKDEENNFMEEAMDKLAWFMDKIFGGEGNTASPNGVAASTAGNEQDVKKFLEVLDELKNILGNLAEQYGAQIINTFLDGLEMLASAVTAGKEAIKYIIGGLLSIAKALLLTGFAMVKALSSILIKVFEAVITLFQTACNQKIDIPLLSDLYKEVTNTDLTLLSVTSLLVAAPATIICKIAHGKAPKEMINATGTVAMKGGVQAMSIILGVSHFVLGAVDTLNDFVGAKHEYGLFKSKTPPNTPPPPPNPPTKGVDMFSISEPSHIVPIAVNILGFFTQGFSVPLISNKDDDRVWNDSYDNVKDGFASTVWYCQFLYNAIGLADWGCATWGSEAVKNVVGTGAKVLTCGLGVVNFGVNIAQIVFDVIDTQKPKKGDENDTQESKKGDAYDAGAKVKLALRSIGSIVSPLPNIGKVLFLFKHPAPVLVGTGLNAIPRLFEGGISIARGCYADV